MSYVEDAIYSFLKTIFTRGIIILTNKRFLMYTTISLISLVVLTITQYFFYDTEVYNFIFNLELSLCMSLIITGLISLKSRLLVEHAFFMVLTILLMIFNTYLGEYTNIIESTFVYVGFYSWILTINVATLNAIRDFVVSWPGWLIRLGDKKGRLMFNPLVKIGLFGSVIWFVYSLFNNFSWSFLVGIFAAAGIFYAIYVLLPYTQDSNLASILCFFYFSLLYHLFVRAETSTGFLLIDIIIIMATTIFTAQGISNFIASKKQNIPSTWDSFIIILLGFMLGYHLLSLKLIYIGGFSNLYSIYHDIAFAVGSLMIYGVLILYATNEEFRKFSKTQVSFKRAFNKLVETGLSTVNNYAKGLKEILKREWTVEFKKEKKVDKK